MAVTPTDDLLERLKDPEYTKLYGAENAKVDFAVTLTKVRKNLNLTQKSLADKLGVSQPRVARLEGGEANPTLGYIGTLLAILGRRLVTQTAPLSPESVSPAIKFIGAADVGAYKSDVAAYIPYREEQYAYIYSATEEPMEDWPPTRKVDYPPRVAVGGTVQ